MIYLLCHSSLGDILFQVKSLHTYQNLLNCDKSGNRYAEICFRSDMRPKNGGVKSSRQEMRRMVIRELGAKCIRCGFSDIRALQLDHINGGGKKEIDKKGYYQMYKYALQVVRSGENSEYQVLCANCNWIKRSENHEL